MPKYAFAICATTLFAVPTVASSEELYTRHRAMGPGHHRYYNRYEGLYDQYESERCRELRPACMHKEELGEHGMGHCRRFRELCD